MTKTRQSGDRMEAAPEEALGAGPIMCEHPDCPLVGEFRAPRSRSELSRFRWFCLDHVREYNAAWNYYAGMDESAVEADIREDVVWRRPTWPLGTRAAALRFGDPLGLFDGAAEADATTVRAGEAQMRSMTAEERRAMATLGLEAPVSRADVKLRYKLLAKTLHPDANGGDKRAEERLKSVNHAYTTLRDSDRLA